MSHRCMLILTTLLASASSVNAAGTYRNPVIAGTLADPAVIFHEGKYHLYCTGDNHSYHVYYSTNLVDWTKGPKVFQPGERNVWAPDVFRDPKNGRFYLYYTVNGRIGVAVADRPDATFADRGTLFSSAIDAHMFYDGEGKRSGRKVKLAEWTIKPCDSSKITTSKIRKTSRIRELDFRFYLKGGDEAIGLVKLMQND